MEVHITARHSKLKDDEQAAAMKAAEHFSHFYENIVRVDAILDEDNLNKKCCEYTVQVQGHTIVGKESGPDFTKAIHDAAEKVVRQLTKLNAKQHETRSGIVARF